MKLFLPATLIGMLFSLNQAVAAHPPADTAGYGVLIINSFDPSADKMRKNKIEFFTELADSLKEYLALFLSDQRGEEPLIIPGLLKDTSSRSIQVLMNDHKASAVVLITQLNVYFEQTNIEVIRDNEGKKVRTAFYDICCTASYTIYHSGITSILPEQKNCEFFTKRNVVSGALAAGPDVVGKKKYTYDMVRKNALNFINRKGFLVGQ